ncbi:MAG TPA: hypothetical protein VFM55_14410 [Micromonosporaceae bacterium]|nr:hypothetical protein [Micromonosporaceae bacterium]
MSDDHVPSLISDDEWDRVVALLPECGPRMEELVRSALQSRGLHPHTVTHRVKRRESAVRKIERKARADYSLSDITDLLGVRVITYFNYDVDQVAEIIEQEFTVDRANSVDKRTSLDPDRFGYLSLHYVVGLSDSRRRLPEYKKFDKVRFEVQIRSILQHAWAEIEHDLGYKSKHAIPAPLRRRFSRLAGLLELADEEFAHIRDSLKEYAAEVNVAIRDNALNVPIDRDSVEAYIRESPRLAELEDRLAGSLATTRAPQLNPRYAEARASEMQAVGFRNLNDVDHALARDGEFLWRFVRNWFESRERNRRRQRRPLNSGVLLLYLAIHGAVQREPADAAALLDRLGVGADLLDQLRAELLRAQQEASVS